MKLLILGGTRFVGRHLVTAALAREHEITLFIVVSIAGNIRLRMQLSPSQPKGGVGISC
ncbi:MAG: hypothetical protein ND866_07015 [Pyrinomonadaceae bacterium]|nr:hypothetical protein [Pyrinomonadaceae bacterium]